MANKKNKKNKKAVPKAANNIVDKCSSNSKEVIALRNNIERISGAILSGKELNPPPRTNLKWPCVICNKNVLSNQNGITCDNCGKWCHRQCDAMSKETYDKYVENDTNPDTVEKAKWYCLYCTMVENHELFPYTLCDDHELDNINNSDNMSFCEHLPSLEDIYETSKFSAFPKPMEEASLPSNLNSKYHSVHDFQKLKVGNNFNIFHANVNGLESKFDTLHTFLGGTASAVDVVAITETSEHDKHSFISNIDMDGYDPFSTPTLSLKGGTALFVNKDYKAFERRDIKIQNNLFESVWIEIKNKNSKNIVCGCIYRHPNKLNQDYTEFNKYMDETLSKLVKENKELYICGDFNIDLLKINEVDTHMKFYTLMNAHGLLPFIVQPTRVVNNQTPSLIDNIFSNNVSDAVCSGNIYFTLSEHFSQFASVNRGKIDIKKIVMYGRNMKNFSEIDFRDDVSIQQWAQDTDDPSILMYDLIWKLNGSAERHGPTEKLSPKDVKLKLKPWITIEIQKLIKIRDRLFTRRKRQPENDHIKEIHSLARNRVSRLLEKSKKEHYDSYFEEHNTNIKKTWEGIRKIVNVKKSTKFSISHLNQGVFRVERELSISVFFSLCSSFVFNFL